MILVTYTRNIPLKHVTTWSFLVILDWNEVKKKKKKSEDIYICLHTYRAECAFPC